MVASGHFSSSARLEDRQVNGGSTVGRGDVISSIHSVREVGELELLLPCPASPRQMVFGLSHHFINASSMREDMEIVSSSLTTMTIIFTHFDYFPRLGMCVFRDSVFFCSSYSKYIKNSFKMS